jgi:hypothetical protein
MHVDYDLIISLKHYYEETNMHLMGLLHKTLKNGLAFIHKKRLSSLMTAVEAAIGSNKLYLTGLGRTLSNKNKTSSNIQKMDRLLGNKQLQNETVAFYRHMISLLIKENSRPWLHIDWSCINSMTNLYVLRASISVSGRSVVIYEKSYTKKHENNDAAHKVFLNVLKDILPASVKPVIVTDAGFRVPWFEHVLRMKWDFVGRLRSINQVLMEDATEWQLSKKLFERATASPKDIGSGLLTLKGKLPARFILYRKSKNGDSLQGKKKKRRSSQMDYRYTRAAREPWLLVTSLPNTPELAKHTVNIYRQRMRIEENFRDTKSPHYGLGLKKSLTRTPGRMDVLLLIAAIATFAAWLAGLFTIHIGKANDFQAHSAKTTSALSKVYLGREAFKKGLSMTNRQFDMMLKIFSQMIHAAQMEAHDYV